MRKLLVAAALAAAALAGSAPAATPTVSIHDNGMEPPLLVVPVGSEVTWRNDGRLQHQTKGGLWESPVLAPGATFAFRFTRLGSYRYEDPLHPGLRGTIWVVPAGRSTSPPKGSRQTTYGAVVDVRVVERITLWDSVMRATHGTCVIEEGTTERSVRWTARFRVYNRSTYARTIPETTARRASPSRTTAPSMSRANRYCSG